MEFNVDEFNLVINNIINKSDQGWSKLNLLSTWIGYLENSLTFQETDGLRAKWGELRQQIDLVFKKYDDKKNDFINELENYRQAVLANNDTSYQNLTKVTDNLKTIENKINELL